MPFGDSATGPTIRLLRSVELDLYSPEVGESAIRLDISYIRDNICNNGVKMKAKIDCIAICAILLCGVIVVGECLTYSDFHDIWVDAEWNEGRVDYSVHSSGSDTYSAVLMDNSGMEPVRELMILVDDGYRDRFTQVSEDGRVLYIDQEYYDEQIKGVLRIRGFTSVDSCVPSSLGSFLEDTMSDAVGKGLIVTTYALPGDVYNGTSDCLLLKWISNGGSLYWVGSEIGSYYLDGDDLIEVHGNQSLFFGSECINVDGPIYADAIVDNGFCTKFSMKGAGIRFSADPSMIEGAVGMGYADSGFCTIVLAPYGSGQVCVFGGPSDINQLEDIGQVIASGMTYLTKIVTSEDGVVTRSTVSSNFINPVGRSTLFVYLGGYYVNHGGVFHEL